MSEIIHQTSQVLQGQVMNNSHPVHPATVHLPIAFLTAAFVLDTLALFPSILISLSSLSILPPVSSFNSIAHYSGAAGILLATPTLITGLGELYEMARAQAQGKDSIFKAVADAFKTKDIPGEKLKTAITHATLNDLVIGVAAFNWWTRRKIVNFALPRFNLYLSAISLPVFAYSAYLGGKLVYEYGVGVQRQGRAKQLKKE